jgi:hypothetical protein
MPDRISFFKTAVLLLEGPNVQIILVLLIFTPANFVSRETTVPKYGYFVVLASAEQTQNSRSWGSPDGRGVLVG